jgi:hypothetical protein
MRFPTPAAPIWDRCTNWRPAPDSAPPRRTCARRRRRTVLRDVSLAPRSAMNAARRPPYRSRDLRTCRGGKENSGHGGVAALCAGAGGAIPDPPRPAGRRRGARPGRHHGRAVGVGVARRAAGRWRVRRQPLPQVDRRSLAARRIGRTRRAGRRPARRSRRRACLGPGSTTVCGIHPGWSTGCRVRTPASTATRSARVRGSDSQARSAPNDLPRPSSPGSGQTAAGTATTGSRFSQVHVWLTDPVRAQLRRGAHSLGRASASLPQGQAGWESSWTWSWWGLESAD